MRIPDVQAEMLEMADTLWVRGCRKEAKRLRELVQELYRRRTKAVRNPAPAKTETVSDNDIWRYKLRHSQARYSDIAAHFGVNPRRVSYALSGKRT
jgi:hypothetical protein